MNRPILVFLLCPLLFACGKVATTATVEQLIGIWHQQSGNGIPLNSQQESAVLTFNADATFTLVIITGISTSTPDTASVRGTYTLSGDQLTTTLADGTRQVTLITIDDRTLLLTDPRGNVSVYTR